jgi:hypothetical protein
MQTMTAVVMRTSNGIFVRAGGKEHQFCRFDEQRRSGLLTGRQRRAWLRGRARSLRIELSGVN